MSTRKEEILEAARAVLIRDGGAEFSVRKVAQAAGMSIGNLQYHFASRVDLLGGLLDADIAQIRLVYHEMTSDAPNQMTDGRELLGRFISKALRDSQHREQVAIFRAFYSFTDPEILARMNAYYTDLYGLLAAGLARLSGHNVESPQIVRAASVLFPCLEGYESSSPVLAMDATGLAQLLTNITWSLLDSEASS